jgi:hypothetical protein
MSGAGTVTDTEGNPFHKSRIRRAGLAPCIGNNVKLGENKGNVSGRH